MKVIKQISAFLKREVYKMPKEEYLSNSKLDGAFDFGVSVSNASALKLTAMYAGIRIRSENIASFPKSVKEKTDNGYVSTNHPANKLISVKPNDYTSVFDFWFSINASLDGWGNAYAIIKRNEFGEPTSLHQLHPSSVNLTMVHGKKYYKVQTFDTNLTFLDGVYPDENMLHFMLVTFDGIKGVNPIVYNAMALGKGLAVQKFGAQYYAKGGNIKAVLETDSSLGKDEYDSFLRNYENGSKNFETPLLEYGIKYKQVGVSPIAAQLIQSETFSIQDICRILNIPPHMVGDLSKATFSNIEHQTLQFIQYSLRPTIKRIEGELERKLFFEEEQGRYSVKFALEGLLRGDSVTRAAFYRNAILDGWMNRNEVRALEGLSKIKGLDDMLYPLNVAVVGKENIEPK